jgi:transcriptional regulator with XRE-family HTH domain
VIVFFIDFTLLCCSLVRNKANQNNFDFKIILNLNYPQVLITLEYLANNLKFLRLKKGLKQHEIKGFSGSKWSNYERNESYPGLEDFVEISNYFGVDEYSLLHVDLSKGEYSLKGDGKKKQAKGELSGGFQGGYLGKKAEKGQLLPVISEPAVEYQKIPKVITVDTQGNENVIMVPVKARAGYLNGYADPEFIATLPAYRLPGLNNGTFRLFEVEGHSMIDSLNDRDIVICSNVDQLALVRDDRVHVVVTKNEGVVVKTVLNRIKTDGKLILKSENYKDREQYPAIICDPSDIIEIWYCVMYMSRYFK